MKSLLTTLMIAVAVAGLAATAGADWKPEDGHKMHWPQLPDPNGWDIDITAPNVVADDWKCGGTGPVRDIHFWFSVEGDGQGVSPIEVLSAIEWLRLSIHSDIPADQSPTGYSMPGDVLWEYYPPDPQILPVPGQGLQGWASPAQEEWRREDHNLFFQANIMDIPDPFIQREGEIYWLDASLKFVDGYDGPRLGWKTTLRDLEFNDDAVYLVDDPTGAPPWRELWEYGDHGGHSLDMAFVITPEPGTLAMLAGLGIVGLMGLGLRRKKN